MANMWTRNLQPLVSSWSTRKQIPTLESKSTNKGLEHKGTFWAQSWPMVSGHWERSQDFPTPKQYYSPWELSCTFQWVRLPLCYNKPTSMSKNELLGVTGTHRETCFSQLWVLFCFFLNPALLRTRALLTLSNSAELPVPVCWDTSVVTQTLGGLGHPRKWRATMDLYRHQEQILKDTNTDKVFKCFSFIV